MKESGHFFLSYMLEKK